VRAKCGSLFINVDLAVALYVAQYENRVCGWRFEGICCLCLRYRRRSG